MDTTRRHLLRCAGLGAAGLSLSAAGLPAAEPAAPTVAVPIAGGRRCDGTYPHFPTRPGLLLDGDWDFCWLGDVKPDDIRPQEAVCRDVMAVPGVFDSNVELYKKRGVGLYRRAVTFPAAAGTRLRLRIHGMGLWGRIWWDGQPLGDYRLPYSGVDFDFTADGRSGHVLAIAVDNRFDAARSPLFAPNFDFYAFGGIYRSVELQALPVCNLERVRITTVDLATGRVALHLRLGGQVPAGDVAFTVAFDGKPAVTCAGPCRDGVVTTELTVPDFRLWSPSEPHLHTATVSIGGDAIVERFGIRTLKAEKQRILLNGKALHLRGVNRHESHPQFGPCQPLHLMLDDLRLLKDLGCNFVRCVHYPQDQRFLDCCDRVGMLVWEESMGWGNGEKDAINPDFAALQAQQTRQMVRNSLNHPAIILWGFLNECCSDTRGGKELYRTLAATVRAEDPSRLVTWASNRKDRDICYEFADVVSMNIYPGWIEGIADWTTEATDLIAPFYQRLSAFMQQPALADKPFLIAEIGACGLYGIHDRGNAPWSEEFQAAFFAESCRCILGDPRCAGIALWQMFDARTYNTGRIREKPRGFNCAGLLDEYRRPKLAYDTVRVAFRAAAADDG